MYLTSLFSLNIFLLTFNKIWILIVYMIHDPEIAIHTCLSYFFLGQIFPQSLSFLNMKNSFLPHIITSIIFYLLLGMVFPSSLLTIIT